MDTALGFGLGYALHAMRARFEFEFGEDPLASHSANDFAIAAMLARAFAEGFDLPTLPLGVAAVHAQQIARKDGGLVAAGTRTDFEVNVTTVARIGRHQKPSQREFLGGRSPFEAARFFLAERTHFRVMVAFKRPGCGELALEASKRLITLGKRCELRVFHGQIAEGARATIEAGIGEQARHFLEAVELSVETLSYGVFHFCP